MDSRFDGIIKALGSKKDEPKQEAQEKKIENTNLYKIK